MKAKHDVTYCINPQCEKKCSRHASHYEFEFSKPYTWQASCEQYDEKVNSTEQM